MVFREWRSRDVKDRPIAGKILTAELRKSQPRTEVLLSVDGCSVAFFHEVAAMIYLLVLFGMALNVAAQVALKFASAGPTGAEATGAEVTGNMFSILADPLRLAMNPWFIFGLVLYAVSVINWVVVLGKLDLSVAYPLMSIGYIFTLLLGAWLFKEPVSLTRIAGVLVIIFGVVLITRPVPHV